MKGSESGSWGSIETGGAESKRCPFCAETIRAEAIKCRFCGSWIEPAATDALSAPWSRPRQGRMFAGVCAGLAERFRISVSVVRLAFLLGLIFSGGMALLVYAALWIAMPSEPATKAEPLSDDRFGPPPPLEP